MLQQDKAVVLAYVDAFNRGDLEGLCRLIAPDAQVWGVLGFGGMDVVRPIWKDLIECLKVKQRVETMVAEGDTVAVRYVESGTSMRAFRGLGPIGKSCELVAMEWFVVKGGLIHRRWGARDFASQSRRPGFPLQ